MKGASVCEKLFLKKDPLEEVPLDAIQYRIEALVSGEGERLLREAIEHEIAAQGQDPRKESAQLRARLDDIDVKASMLLETITPETRDFIQAKLSDLNVEKCRLSRRLEELDSTPYRPVDADAVMCHGLAELQRLPHLLESCASLEKRKEFIRMFVAGVTVEPDEKRLTIEMRRLPAAHGLTPPG